jgi:hypothetical protein
MPIELHELHRRRLEGTVKLIENGLERMERLLNEGGQQGIVHAIEHTLSSEQRGSLLERIGQLRTALGEFAARFALQQHPLEIRQVLNAELSSAWVMLENCRPKRMKGYGVKLDDPARSALEENLEHLLAHVAAMRARLQ